MKKTGIKPTFEGVPGELLNEAPEGLTFGEKKLRKSPYDPLLIQLRDAGPGKYLKFGDLRARVSLLARSKKLGIRLLFGEQDNTLWVTLAKAELTTEGKSEESPRKTLADVVMDAIRQKRTTAGEILTFVRSAGAAGGVGLTQIDGVLAALRRQFKVKLKSQDGVDRWSIA